MTYERESHTNTFTEWFLFSIRLSLFVLVMRQLSPH